MGRQTGPQVDDGEQLPRSPEHVDKSCVDLIRRPYRLPWGFGEAAQKPRDLFLGGSTQDLADGSTPDVEPASDLNFGDASAM
jgi:hypothetical protein